MILAKDLTEVRKRDFLKNYNHYNDLNNIETKLVFGKQNRCSIYI